MEDEFDDDLDLDQLCSQVPIDICCDKPSTNQNENVFKKPKYSFNRVQQNRTFQASQQSSNALKSQTHQQNRFNQIAAQTSHPNKLQTVSKPLNAQQPNQRPDSRPTNTNANNKLKPNHAPNKPGQTATFVKPNPPPPPQPFTYHNPGNAPFSNLNKSIAAQNRNKDCQYSINKQFVTSSPRRPIKPAPGPVIKPAQSTSSNQRFAPGARSESSISTIRSTQSTGVSQFQVTIPGSQSTANRSSFNISNNVSAEVTVKQQLLTTLKNDDNDGIDPSDKYIGKLQMLETQLKKKDTQLKEAQESIDFHKKQCEIKDKQLARLTEAKQTAQFFNKSACMSRDFHQAAMTQVDETSPILDQTISSTTYQRKKPSPKKRTQANNQTILSAIPSQSVPIPSFDLNDDLLDLNLEDNNDESEFIIPDTQCDVLSSPTAANDLNESDPQIIPETQFPAENKRTNQTMQINRNQTAGNRTEFELSVMRPTQLENETVSYQISHEAMFESDDEAPATQFIGNESSAATASASAQTVAEGRQKKSRSAVKSETKRIKTRQTAGTVQDDAVFHQARFKFVDFQVYDSMYEDNRMGIFRENVNPIFDRILEKIISLNLLNIEEELNSFEFKYNKLNEESVLMLINLEFSSRIPELTFDLLSNLNRKAEYTAQLADRDLLFKLTSKCCIVEERDYNLHDVNQYENHRTLFNKMLEIFSKCRIIAEGDSRNCYLRLCYSILNFLNEHTVEHNTFRQFHDFQKKDCRCWRELHDVLSQFALYLLDIFDEQNNLHALLVQDLTKFVISLMRTKSLPRNTIGQTRFRHFGQKLSAKVEFSTKFNYLDYLYTL